MASQSPELGRKVAVLVDFDNVYDHTPGADLGWFGHEINKLVALSLSIVPAAEFVSVRLYGGWLEKSVLTPLASDLQSAIGARPYFPLTHPTGSGSLLRGDIILVTRLIDVPTVEWVDTRKHKLGIPRIRLARETLPNRCANPNNCPVTTLSRFTKHKNKRCPANGCDVTNAEAFVSVEQKMVDTLLACDLISLIRGREHSGVLVVSDDADVVPAVAVAGQLANGIRLRLLQSPSNSGSFDGILAALGVQCTKYAIG